MSPRNRFLAGIFSLATTGCAGFMQPGYMNVDTLNYNDCFLNVRNESRVNLLLFGFNWSKYVDSKWDDKCADDRKDRIRHDEALKASSEGIVDSIRYPSEQREEAIAIVIRELNRHNPDTEKIMEKSGYKVESLLAERIGSVVTKLQHAEADPNMPPAELNALRKEVIDIHAGETYPRYAAESAHLTKYTLIAFGTTIEELKDSYLGKDGNFLNCTLVEQDNKKDGEQPLEFENRKPVVTFTLCGQKRSDVFPELQSRIPDLAMF